MRLPDNTVLTNVELRAVLEEYRRQNWRGIQTPRWQEKIVDDIVQDGGESIFARLSGVWRTPQPATVLDIGSGVGTFVLACRKRGLLAFGIEPDRIGHGDGLTSIQIAKRRVEYQAFAVAVGEKLPFSDQSFDLITMDQVMEHVSDQAAVLGEAARVLKPGGAIYIASPNYLRFYEPHYKIFWIPLLSKTLGRLYLKARGRNPVLLNQIIYTTNKRLRAVFQQLPSDYAIIDLHRESFLEKCKHGGFQSFRARCARWLASLPVVGRGILSAALLYIRVTEGGCEMVILRHSR